jgi:DNA invertase Pin-like site-specific DNA recombinase
MSAQRPSQIKSTHLSRLALIYIRLARRAQENQESIAYQRGQREFALHWGWPENRIEICEDLGFSGATADQRPGFKRVVELIGQGDVGLVLSADISRLTRSNTDLEALLALCLALDTLLAIDGVTMVINDSANR